MNSPISGSKNVTKLSIIFPKEIYQDRITQYGFEILEEDIQSLADLKIVDKFDVVCALQVLEYVTEPGLFLRGMLDNLKVGGL